MFGKPMEVPDDIVSDEEYNAALQITIENCKATIPAGKTVTLVLPGGDELAVTGSMDESKSSSK